MDFSDDEKFLVDHILAQRKRKGVLEYLVRWKGADESQSTWEPAKTIASDCAKAVQAFLQDQKTQKRSKSKTRTSSRSRSRSSSRGRKATTTKAGKSSRSSSRGRAEKKTTPATTPTDSKVDITSVRRSLRQKAAAETTAVVEETEEVKIVKETIETHQVMSSASKPVADVTDNSTRRSLRSSTLEKRKELEVQRVHNDQRPQREDDARPRSPVWRIADYIVIVLFVISVTAALFLFLEKFVNLEGFKKQAFPNFSVLRGRLEAGYRSVMDLGESLMGRISDGWLYVVEQVKRPESIVKAKAAKA